MALITPIRSQTTTKKRIINKKAFLTGSFRAKHGEKLVLYKSNKTVYKQRSEFHF